MFHVFHVNEIHSSFFDVWFSYGLIPMLLLTYWIMKHAVRCSRRQRAAVIALLAESFTLMNLRQPFFWFILIYGSCGYVSLKRGKDVQENPERINAC